MVEEIRLSGRYRLDERLAAGGMGSVYAGQDELLSRKVAVKLLKEELAGDPRFVERFRREARSVAGLSHPNIAAVFDYGEEDGRQFIVMELVEGRDLARVIHADGALGPERSVRIGGQVLAALEHAHAAGIVHRDVKPANVIIGPGDRVKVTDFGIARATGQATLTATGSVLGSAHYIAPEQADGRPTSPATDIYSAGIVLYEMLVGKPPFTGESALQIAMRHVTDTVPPPSAANADVPPGLDAIVARATAKNPDDRFASAAQMGTALEAALDPTQRMDAPAATSVLSGAGAGATAPLTEASTPPPPPAPGAARAPGGGGRRAMGVLLVLLAVAGLAAASLYLLNRTGGGGSNAGATQQDQPGGNGNGGGGAPGGGGGSTPTDTTVTLDSFIGESYADAASQLQAAGLVPARRDATSDQDPETVIDQDPPAGTEVQEGDTITLTVSSGPAVSPTPQPTTTPRATPSADSTPSPRANPSEPKGQAKAKGQTKGEAKGKKEKD